VEALATALWYPLWDAGLKLGHAVRSVDDQLALADDDLDTATSMLTVRHLAGDGELAERIEADSRARWRRHGRRWLEALRVRGLERRAAAGDVAYLLEPDLKEGHGGLRDVQTLRWAAEADLVVPGADLGRLEECYDRLLEVRVELHRETGRPGEVLRLQQQDAVATRLAFADADALMAEVAAAARSIVWVAEGAWRDVGRHQVGGERLVAPGVAEQDLVVELADGADVRADPALVWRLARVAAERERPIGRDSLDALAAATEPATWATSWPPGARDELVRLLAQGHRAIDPLEALDQRGILATVLPEWEPVRSRPQRNAYHRYTVDRHLWEAAANAAALTSRVARPDLLLLGALFHDLGKGYPGDHTDVGMELIDRIGPRLGLGPPDVATIRTMIEHHLLLPDTAVRRDLNDPATIRRVRDAVGDLPTLRLLHALTEADSLATGPSAWGSWKEQLVAELVGRTAATLEDPTRPVHDVVDQASFPDPPTWTAMAGGRVDIAADEPADDGTSTVTVVAPDHPGTFARVAGALALRGLDITTSWAASADVGAGPMAASRFRVRPAGATLDWDAISGDLRRALDGQLAIEARLAERARTYRRRKATQAAPPSPPAVSFHDDDSDLNTVIEVRAANRIGVLHQIARALTDIGLDIRHATVQSLGEDVVDTFYVRTLDGDLVVDAFHRTEIERAVLHAVSSPGSH
ncbi:MAG: [protein-PII] uridylyltransferase, partial [Desertimonas sp.]